MRKKIFGSKYYITDDGLVENETGQLIPLGVCKRGYTTVKLENKKVRSVQKLVMEAFVGPDTKAITHRDGDKSNNAVWNLEYVSRIPLGDNFYYKAYQAMDPLTIHAILKRIVNEDSLESIAINFRVPIGLILLIIQKNIK